LQTASIFVYNKQMLKKSGEKRVKLYTWWSISIVICRVAIKTTSDPKLLNIAANYLSKTVYTGSQVGGCLQVMNKISGCF